MQSDLLKTIFSQLNPTSIVELGKEYSFQELHVQTESFLNDLAEIPKGAVVGFDPHFGFPTISIALALYDKSCILVPMPPGEDKNSLVNLLEIEYFVTEGSFVPNRCLIETTGKKNTHLLVNQIRLSGDPGLVVLSSGSTGKPKAALHNFKFLAEPYLSSVTTKRINRILAFHSFHRIAGVSMLLHALTSHSALIAVGSAASPDDVGKAIEDFKVDVLPASPSFLSLMIVAGVFEKYNMSSLKLVNFGSEPSSEQLVKTLKEKLPNVRLRQVYGTSELGLVKTKSDSSNSLYFKSDDPNVNLRVVDGLLEIKSNRQLLGYLHPKQELPLTEDGWFKTGDRALEKGGEIRVLGRGSDIIKVAGNLVYPVEIESVIQEIPGVMDASVFGEENALLGEMVVAKVVVSPWEDLTAWRPKILAHCRSRLPNFMVPQKIEMQTTMEFVGEFKKKRK